MDGVAVTLFLIFIKSYKTSGDIKVSSCTCIRTSKDSSVDIVLSRIKVKAFNVPSISCNMKHNANRSNAWCPLL